MSEASGSGGQTRRPRINTPGGIFVRDLPPGAKLRMSDGAIVEVVQNARDGGWLLGRYVEHEDSPDLVGTEDWIYFGDVVEEVQ
jgi:hypothetical protein